MLGAGFIIGYACTLIAAIARISRRSHEPLRVQVFAFVRAKGFDAAMFAWISLFSAALGGLLYGGVLCILLEKVAGVALSSEARWQIVGLAALVTYLGCFGYAFRKLVKE